MRYAGLPEWQTWEASRKDEWVLLDHYKENIPHTGLWIPFSPAPLTCGWFSGDTFFYLCSHAHGSVESELRFVSYPTVKEMAMQLPMQLWHSHFLICGNDCPCVPTKKYNQKENEHGTVRYHHCIIFQHLSYWYMGVSENSGTPKSSILIGCSILSTIHFGVPLFLETPIYLIMLSTLFFHHLSAL